jgi:hypothetical protein
MAIEPGNAKIHYPELFINATSSSGILPLFPIVRQDAASTRFMNNPGYLLLTAFYHKRTREGIGPITHFIAESPVSCP